MKNIFIIFFFAFVVVGVFLNKNLSCGKAQMIAESSARYEFDVSRNRAYISIQTGGDYWNYSKYVFDAINRFEDEKRVEVIDYDPQIDIDSEDLRGVWVIFKEKPTPKSEGPRPEFKDGIMMMPPKPSRAKKPQ